MRLLRPVERVSRKVVGRVRKKPLEPWAEHVAQAFSEAAGMIGHSPEPHASGVRVLADRQLVRAFVLRAGGHRVRRRHGAGAGLRLRGGNAVRHDLGQHRRASAWSRLPLWWRSPASASRRPRAPAIGLVYRGIVFWMPFIIGAVLINTTKAFKGDVKKAAYDQDMGAVAGTAATAARLQEEAHADAVRVQARGGFALAYGGCGRCACDAWRAAGRRCGAGR